MTALALPQEVNRANLIGVAIGIDECFEWGPSLDLELRVLRPTQLDGPARLDQVGRDEPATPVPGQGEEVVYLALVKLLGQAGPALVATIGRDADVPASLPPRSFHSVGRGFHLDSQDSFTELGHQVDVGAVPHGQPDEGALAGQPLDGGGLTDVTLCTSAQVALPPVVSARLAHRMNVLTQCRQKVSAASTEPAGG
ncbi:MAG TPA: hypothetical protein VHR18_01685 [Solirubrobacterales bacterium]|nr:hypothetical protein [Solirubrobacterales bacterium]